MSQKPTNLPYFLGPEKEKKDEYKRVLTDTIEAITASVSDQGAYQGASVEALQQTLAQFSLLPSHGIGWEALLEQVKQTILPTFSGPGHQTTWLTCIARLSWSPLPVN